MPLDSHESSRRSATVWFCSQTNDAMFVSTASDEEYDAESCACGGQLYKREVVQVASPGGQARCVKCGLTGPDADHVRAGACPQGGAHDPVVFDSPGGPQEDTDPVGLVDRSLGHADKWKALFEETAGRLAALEAAAGELVKVADRAFGLIDAGDIADLDSVRDQIVVVERLLSGEPGNEETPNG